MVFEPKDLCIAGSEEVNAVEDLGLGSPGLKSYAAFQYVFLSTLKREGWATLSTSVDGDKGARWKKIFKYSLLGSG